MSKVGQEVIKCTKCGGNKIIPTISPAVLGFLMLLTASVLVWIPILGWIAAPLAIVIAFVCFVIAVLPSAKKTMNCYECKNRMAIDKQTYREWKAL